MADLLTTITEVPVADVQIGRRLRPVSPNGVAALIASIGELGVMKDAVHVRKKKDGTLHLMAGAHRLTAARELGWQTIAAKVWTCTDDWAALMEIDDNLASAELTALDTAVFLAARKRVYEKLHPETKSAIGAKLVSRRWHSDTSDIVSFVSATSEKLGISKRHVERLVAAGTALTSDNVRWLRDAPRPVTLKDLQVIAKVEEDHERSQICIKLSEGRARTAAAARTAYLAAVHGEKPVAKDPGELSLKALRDAWSRASKADRKRFLTVEGKVIFDLLRELRAGDTE